MFCTMPIMSIQCQCCGLVITTTQLHSTKLELRFCADSNPACGFSRDLHW